MIYRKPLGEHVSQQEAPNLYKLEEQLEQAVTACMEERKRIFNEKPFQEALPEVLFTLFDAFDTEAIKITCEAFLERLEK